MVFPDKHIGFSESLLGLGSLVLDSLSTPKSIDSLWQELKRVQQQDHLFVSHNFENLVLAVDVLFAIGLLTMNTSGLLQKKASSKIEKMIVTQ